MENTSDPHIDLELNLEYLSNDLYDLIDNNNNDLESVSFDNYNFNDGYSRDVPVQEHTEDFQNNFTNNDEFNGKNFQFHNNNYISHQASQHQQQEILFPNVPIIPDVIMPQHFIPALHHTTTSGNVLMQLMPLMAPYYHIMPNYPHQTIMMPFIPDPQTPIIFEKCDRTRAGRCFNKTFPRRNPRGFSMFPQKRSKWSEATGNIDDIVIDLRELNIGPSSLYESTQTKLMNKFKAALQYLSNLANECIEMECIVLKQRHPRQVSKVNFTKDVTGYQFCNYLKCIINHSKLEQISAHVMFMSLHQLLIEQYEAEKLNISEIGSYILGEMKENTEALCQLSSLNIMRDVVLDVNEEPEELKKVNETIKDFIKAVRTVTTCLWSLKVLFVTNEIKNFSMD